MRSLSARPLLAASVLALSSVLAIPGPASAVTGWSGPTTILSGQHVTELRTGVDRDGRVAVLGRDEDGLFSLRQRPGGWRLVRIVGPVHLDPYQRMAGVFDRDGHAYAAWVRQCTWGDCSKAGIWFATDAGGAWVARRLVAGKELNDPAIQLHGGDLHLAYTDADRSLHYATDASGHWVDVRIGPDQVFSPMLALDPSGRPHIAATFLGPEHGGIHSIRVGGTPAAPTFTFRRVHDTNESDHAPQLAFDAKGGAWLAWTREDYCGIPPCPLEPHHVWTSRWKDGRWTHPVLAVTNSVVALRVTPAGSPRLLTQRVAFLRRSGSGWSSTRLYDPQAYRNHVPAAAMALALDGRATVVLADVVRVSGRWVGRVSLMREQ